MAERTYWEEQLELVRKQYQDVHEKWFKLMSSNMTEEADPLKDEESILFDEIMEIRQKIAAVRSQEMSESSSLEEQLVAVRKQYQEIDKCIKATGYKESWDLPKNFGKEVFQKELIRNEEIKQNNSQLWDEACILSIQKKIIQKKIVVARVKKMKDVYYANLIPEEEEQIENLLKVMGEKENQRRQLMMKAPEIEDEYGRMRHNISALNPEDKQEWYRLQSELQEIRHQLFKISKS